MKRNFTIFIALVIGFFTLPFGGNTALADKKVYDNLEDGTYDIEANAKKEGTNEKSTAADYMSNKATLTVENGQFELKLFIPDNPALNFEKLVVASAEPTVTPGEFEGKTGNFYIYSISELQRILSAVTTYKVPFIGLVHEDVGLDFHLDGLDEIPEKQEDEEDEKPTPGEPAPEERVVGVLIPESEADAVYGLEYETDSDSTRNNLLNPVKLLEKDDKQYIQIRINEKGANFFRSLEINGEQVIWNSITEGPYMIQFELPGDIGDTLLLDMVIQAGPNVMAHDGIEVWFKTDPTEPEPETPKEPEEEPEENDGNGSNDEDKDEGVTPDKTEVNYVVKHATEDKASAADMFFTKPGHLIERDGETYIQLTITSWSMIDWLRTDQGDVVVVKENSDGSVVVEFKVTGDLSDAIILSMSMSYGGKHEARLFLDVDEDGNGGTPAPTPTPTPTPKPVPTPKAEEKSEIVPDKVYEIDYVVKHATEDKESAANSFFTKPAHILYINGEKYIQLTIKDWNMIDWLRTEHGDVIVVKENDDGSALIQFKLDGDLSDEILLSMKVTVPGLYSMEHDARLIFDVESQKEIDASDFQIVIDKEGSDPGPEGTEGPGKPEFGNGETTDKNIDGAVKSGKTNNPQTGDTTSIFLYAMLLMGSLAPLAVKLRRRFV